MNYSLVCYKKNQQVYELEKEEFDLDEGYLLVEVDQASICGSDYMVLHGTHPYKKYPAILGHEFIGRVVEKNGVDHIQVGDLVTSLSYGYCEKCNACLVGEHNHCQNKVTYNTAGSSGSFTKKMTVHHTSLEKLNHIDYPLKNFVLSEPISIVIHALNKLNLKKNNENIIIIGAGAIGMLSAVYIKEKYHIDNITFIDNNSERQEFVRELGFHSEPSISDLPTNSMTAIIVAGGERLEMSPYIDLVQFGGRISLISYFDEEISLDFNSIVRKEILIYGSFLSNKKDLREAIDFIEYDLRHNVKLDQIITDRVQFKALKDFMLGSKAKGKVLVESIGNMI